MTRPLPLDNYERVVAIGVLTLIGAAILGAMVYALVRWLRRKYRNRK